MPAEDLATRRLALGEAAVFSLTDAAELLPIRETDARRWLRSRGLVRQLEGRDVVTWRKVLDAIEAGDEPAPPPRGRRRVRCLTLPVDPLH